MITSSDLYWITRLDAIRAASTCLGTASVVALIICLVIHLHTSEEDDVLAGKDVKLIYSRLRIAVVCSLLFMFQAIAIGTFLPTTNEAVLIYGVPLIINSEVVQDDLPKESKELYGLVKKYLNGKMEEE